MLFLHTYDFMEAVIKVLIGMNNPDRNLISFSLCENPNPKDFLSATQMCNNFFQSSLLCTAGVSHENLHNRPDFSSLELL